MSQVGFVRSEALETDEIDKVVARQDRCRVAPFTAPFGSGSWRAEVWLTLAVRGGRKVGAILGVAEHGCLVSVEIWDEALTAADKT